MSLPSLEAYPATPSFTPTPRFLAALSSFARMHATDHAAPAAQTYHSTLDAYCRKLATHWPADGTDGERISTGPSEAVLLAANCQHIRRWEHPRSTYPEGLSGYKMWRTSLNRFHADIAISVLTSSGYSQEDPQDAELIERVRALLLKKTLARPPLPVVEELKDPEAHLFEDAVCLAFLALEFAKFAQPYLAASTSPSPSPSIASDPSAAAPAASAPSPHVNPEKLVGIVSKTWAKMTSVGRNVAVEELVGTLPEDLKAVVFKAVS
ncbi:hypothetical protein JCM8097_006225 [Rhodosporidiobolus ruineniae]